ncbi:hypothetical protein [Cellulomonas hominis]
MGRPRYRHTPNPGASDSAEGGDGEAVEVPVVLPHAVFTVREDGDMTVTVDGTPHEPEAFAPPWRRESFPAIIDALTGRRRTPVRVEVREADGAVFTDIITPGQPRRPAAEPEPEADPSLVPGLVVLHGEGFVPGEDVAVAVIVAHSDAAPDGTARGVLARELLAASPTREVILLGRVSGT